jgi:hypothetical protein
VTGLLKSLMDKELISVFLMKNLMKCDKLGVESIEHVEFYMEASFILLERTHE